MVNNMQTIAEETIDTILAEIEGFSPDKFDEEMEKLNKNQPLLFTFILEFTEEFEEELLKIILLVFFAIYRVFHFSYKKKIPQISSEQIVEQFNRNDNFFKSLDEADEVLLDRIAEINISTQPHLVDYLLEVLFEITETEEEIDLADEDSIFIYLLLKTEIDLLDSVTG